MSCAFFVRRFIEVMMEYLWKPNGCFSYYLKEQMNKEVELNNEIANLLK
jgi:hypothetical protein